MDDDENKTACYANWEDAGNATGAGYRVRPVRGGRGVPVSRRGCLRHDARRDSNEKAIVVALEAQGFVVDRMSGKGLPDLLVSKAGRQWLVEVKTPKGIFKPAQIEWRQRFRGPAPVTLRSVEDACKFMLLAMESESRALTYGRQVVEREQRITGNHDG